MIAVRVSDAAVNVVIVVVRVVTAVNVVAGLGPLRRFGSSGRSLDLIFWVVFFHLRSHTPGSTLWVSSPSDLT